MLNPLTIAWTRANNKALGRGSTLLERYDTPLAFEPGASWMYSTSIDYVGLLVERASGGTLEAYMKTHFWGPLGIKDMTFHLSTRPDMKERLVDMSFRTAEGKVSAEPEDPGLARMPFRTLEGKEVDGCFGGEGLFATPEEYIKVLRAVLDGSIVPASFAQEVFKPQLSQAQADAMNSFLQMDVPNNAMGHTKKNVRKNWGLGGLLLDADDHDKGRKEGTMIWTGLPMLSWFVDRKTGICGFFATQIMPTGDQKAAELMNVFVDGIYALASSSGKENGRL
jgi:CubicO group peptidase (beta-lactamase class C family)